MVQIFNIPGSRGRIVTIKRVVGIVGLLILSASYALSPTPPDPEEMQANRERWRSLGVKNYQMRFQMHCFCDLAERSILVDVRNGLVHWAVYEDDGTPVSLSDVDSVHSIDSLFAMIKRDLLAGWSVHADYDAEYGYPESVGIDSDFATDLYTGYGVELLTITEEDASVPVHKTPEEIVRQIYGQMVSIPAGTFRMGDFSGKGANNDRPVHSVTVPAFKLGKYEVTFAQWNTCMADGGCNGYRPYGSGHGGSRPVGGVSWDDVQSFVGWLNNKTGGNFRLSTEAEWEYAARAGTTTEYSWGDDIGSSRANCDNDDCGDSWGYTALVGSFPANAWGLHDMHGNVAEWVQDCGWLDTLERRPTDGSAWTSGDCEERVLLGTSWSTTPSQDYHLSYEAHVHGYDIGFRLAQDE